MWLCARRAGVVLHSITFPVGEASPISPSGLLPLLSLSAPDGTPRTQIVATHSGWVYALAAVRKGQSIRTSLSGETPFGKKNFSGTALCPPMRFVPSRLPLSFLFLSLSVSLPVPLFLPVSLTVALVASLMRRSRPRQVVSLVLVHHQERGVPVHRWCARGFIPLSHQGLAAPLGCLFSDFRLLRNPTSGRTVWFRARGSAVGIL